MGTGREEVFRKKKELRNLVLSRRDQMSEQERQKASMLLTDRIIGHQWFYQADSLLCFLNFGSEISTRELIQEAFRKEKKVFVPKVMGEEIQFYEITSMDNLKAGYHGILEPEGDTREFVPKPLASMTDPCQGAFMLMPGVAFDPMRNRLGYGKGFYDRFLTKYPQLAIHTIGIGFQCQLVEEVPQEDGDIRPYQVILM